MNELHIYFKNLLNQSADDDEFTALLNETALSGTNISNLNFKIVEKNKKQLEKLYHTEISYPLAVLLTNIFNNQMPDEEDELDNLVFDVKKRAKIEEYNVEDFTSNYYYKNILPLLKKYQTKSEKFGNIYFSTDFYSAYNIFLSDEIYLDSHFKEITPLAYFSKDFHYPLVSNNSDQIWMSIIPHEINTMAKAISHATNNILVYGLGLGYFPIMAAAKEDVKKIVVVENDKNIINLFLQIILPCFPKEISQKIEIVEKDVFAIAEKISPKEFNYVFADIWHNEKDGLSLYQKLLKLEKNNIEYDYWIEDTILVYFQKILLFILDISQNNKYEVNFKELDEEYQQLCAKYRPLIAENNFKTIDDFKNFFQKENLKKLLKKN